MRLSASSIRLARDEKDTSRADRQFEDVSFFSICSVAFDEDRQHHQRIGDEAEQVSR